jgi:hypothetical protein
MILLLSANAITVDFQKAITAQNIRASFVAGYASSNSSISVIVNPTTAGVSYTVQLWRPNQAFPFANPFQTAGPYSGPAAFNSSMLDMTGSWTVQVITTGTSFMFNIQFTANNVSSGPFIGIASQGHVFTLYYGQQGSYTATAGLSSGAIGDLNFAMYGPFSSLSYTGGTPLPTTSLDAQDVQISYQTAGN